MSLSDDIERLKHVPFLGLLDDEVLRLIAFNGERLEASHDQTLFYEGEAAQGALFILEGGLSLQMLVKGELRERSVLHEGALIDAYALISEMRRSATAKAVGDVRALLLDRKTFRRVLENYPGLAEKIQDFLAKDIDRTVRSLNNVAVRLDFLD